MIYLVYNILKEKRIFFRRIYQFCDIYQILSNFCLNTQNHSRNFQRPFSKKIKENDDGNFQRHFSRAQTIKQNYGGIFQRHFCTEDEAK